MAKKKKSNNKASDINKSKPVVEASQTQTQKKLTLKDRWNERSPVLRFILLFLLFIGIFYAFWATNFFHEYVVKQIAQLDARIAGFLLNIFGYETTVHKATILSDDLTLNVKTGCDGIEGMAVFVSGVLAFAAPWAHKLKGLFFGLLFLFCVNLIRVIHLYWAGINIPKYFDFLHHNFWQVVFILVSIVTWAVWINRTTPKVQTQLLENDQ